MLFKKNTQSLLIHYTLKVNERMTMKERIAIVQGTRSPMQKMGTGLATLNADTLGAYIVKECVETAPVDASNIDDFIFGNCAQPAHAANVARVIQLLAGLPKQIPAVTVHRNCASGMEAITTAADRLLLGRATTVLAGGVESMSHIPFLFSSKAKSWFSNLQSARTLKKRLGVLSQFKPAYFKPEIGLLLGLTDPVCNQLMGMTAENLAREFSISRETQDSYALDSHLKALKAIQSGRLAKEITPMITGPKKSKTISHDNGPREGQTIEALQKLKPYFDRKNGTVTVGTSSQVTDGAAALVLKTESQAKADGIEPLGYLTDYAYAGCDPHRMGLGPTYAISKLLEQQGRSLSDVDLFEINEAFAAQVIANFKAMASSEFCEKELNRSSAIGQINPDTCNVNGGAIALGHPLGMSGTRIVLSLLHELHEQNKQTGIASLCVGGGQGAALLLERQ